MKLYIAYKDEIAGLEKHINSLNFLQE
jgi:hypothetical protein